MADKKIIQILTDKKLKVTPQRLAILEVLLDLDSHPTAEEIISYLRISYPAISLATVYKCLDMFVRKGIVKKVNSSSDQMRYDTVGEDHHHIYCSDTGEIRDFHDSKLTSMIKKYFSKNPIPGFNIEDLRLQISGKYAESRKIEKVNEDTEKK